VQVPLHCPLTQAELVQATAAPQVPLELQVWTPLPGPPSAAVEH
jgi:hypothetical protein